MKIRFNVTGAARKAFVMAVGDLVGWEPIYTKAPTFAYVVNNLTIDKEGTLLFPEGMDMTEAEQLLAALAVQGYVSEDALPTTVSLGEDATEEESVEDAFESEVLEDVGEDESVEEDLADTVPSEGEADAAPEEDAPIRAFPEQVADTPDALCISLPWAGFTEQSYQNLVRLVESKAGLICQSIGAEELVIQHDEECVYFPWFSPESTTEEVNAYTQLVGALCKMAKEQQRVTATSREVENPKYAMRCFLLRLCFIGDEFAAARKLLLKNLSGNSSFKSGARKERPANNAPNPADSAPLVEGDDSAGDVPNSPETAPTGGDNGLAEALADAALIHEVNASFESEEDTYA